MSLGLWNLQWLNHNSQRSYPLTERASKTDTLNTIRLPDSFIVALKLPVNAGLNIAPEKFYIKSLLLAPTGYNITIGYDAGETNTEDNPDIAAANIAKSTYSPNRAYALGGIDDFADTIGQIVIGRLDEIDALPPGRYFFSPAAGQLEPDAIVPNIRAVTRLRISNSGEVSAPIYGDVILTAGTNMRLGLTTQENEDPTITFSAISGLNLNEDCFCDVHDTGTCIRCINGECSKDGNFQINQGECVDVARVTGGLFLSDTCAQPCCGCTELDAITTQIDRFGDGVTTLQSFVTRLSSEVTQMSLVVLGSRLGDTGCSTC